MMVGYVGEIAPLKLRGILTCFLGVSYGIGPLVAFIIIKYTGNVETRWAYRTIFCSQWGFAAVAAVVWPWMPEYVGPFHSFIHTFTAMYTGLTFPDPPGGSSRATAPPPRLPACTN